MNIYPDTYATRNRGNVARWYKSALTTNRVAKIGLSHSYEVFGGHGMNHGLSRALYRLYGSYGTGLMPIGGDSTGASPSIGYLCTANGSARDQNASLSGAPTALNAYGPAYATNATQDGSRPLGWYHGYGYVPPGTTYTASSYVNKVIIDPAHPMDITGPLRARTSFGTFPSAFGIGSGINPVFANRNAGNPTYGPVSTTAAGYGLIDVVCDIAAGPMYPGGYPLEFGHNPQGSADIVGPFFQQYGQISNRSKTKGFTYQTLLYAGGLGNDAYLASLIQLGTTARREYFRQVALELDSDMLVIFSFTEGLHRAELSAPSNGPSYYAADWQSIHTMLRNDWGTVTGKDNCAFEYVAVPPMASGYPDNAQYDSYREAERGLSDSNPNTTSIDIYRSTTFAAMSSLMADAVHPNQNGFEWLGEVKEAATYPAGAGVAAATLRNSIGIGI